MPLQMTLTLERCFWDSRYWILTGGLWFLLQPAWLIVNDFGDLIQVPPPSIEA